jgi:RHS repeat-associated protein
VATTTTYTWDSNGRLVKKAESGQVTLYGWDSEDHLIEVRRGATDATAQTVATYAYDAFGHRVKQVEKTAQGDRVTTYLTDTTFPYAQVIEAKTQLGTQTQTARYVWGAGLIAQVQNGQGRYYHAEGLGSVKALSDGNGALTDAYEYEAFGEVLSHSGASEQPYRFAGEYFDPIAGMQYHRARWYDTNIGRFTALDSFSGNPNRPATLNKYLYAGANPVNVRDPSGAFGVADASAASNIAITLSNIQIDFGVNFINAKLNGGDESASSIGWGILASLAPVAIGSIAKGALKITSKMGNKGKVAYPVAKAPLDKEIEMAEFIAEKLGVGIYLRGGRSAEGPDAFISGKRWELKKINGSASSVKSNLDKALDQFEKHNPGVPVRVVLDGRDGLTWEAFDKGLGKVQASRRQRIFEIMVILENGEIYPWPF